MLPFLYFSEAEIGRHSWHGTKFILFGWRAKRLREEDLAFFILRLVVVTVQSKERRIGWKIAKI